jgi:hypothetical protein
MSDPKKLPTFVIGAIGAITYDAYLNDLLKVLNTLRLSINPNAIGTGPDLMLPEDLKAKAIEVMNLTNEVSHLLPAFTERLLTLALGAQYRELSKILPLHLGSPSQTASIINCEQLQQEIDRAADAGLQFTLAQQAEFKKECPGLKFPPRR